MGQAPLQPGQREALPPLSPPDITGAMKQFWMVKQEPGAYSWEDFVRDGGTDWTGVRNFQARNNLRDMKKGDEVLFYHSVSDKAVVGRAKVAMAAFPDPTADDPKWLSVRLEPLKALKNPVTLDTIKNNPALVGIGLVRNSRLSVIPLSAAEHKAILSLA